MINCQKKLFSISNNIHYFNCAYMAPILKSAELASIKAIEKQRNPINFKPNNFFDHSQEIRIEYSKIINSKPNEIAIMPSTSYGFSSALNNIYPQKNKTNVVTIENEFPSGYFAIKKWSETNNKKLIVVEQKNMSPEKWNEKIVEQITTSTSIVLLSSVHWMNGTKLNLKEIGEKCKKVDAYFIVDGTQSVGAAPIDVKSLNIDALICAAYKWLFGPYSMALGYFSNKFNDGIPIEESWMNRLNAHQFSELTNYDSRYTAEAGRYNVGQTSNFILTPIMFEGLKQLNKWGIENISEYCKNLSSKTRELCEPLGIKFQDQNYSSSHLFSLELNNKNNIIELKEKLEKNNIYVSVRGEFLRISVNVFNDIKDIEKLVETLK